MPRALTEFEDKVMQISEDRVKYKTLSLLMLLFASSFNLIRKNSFKTTKTISDFLTLFTILISWETRR